MSRTEIAVAYEDGVLVPKVKFQNAHLGALHIWSLFCVKYSIGANNGRWGRGKFSTPTTDDLPKAWNFHTAHADKLPAWESNVMYYTYDKFVVRRTDMLLLAASLRFFEEATARFDAECASTLVQQAQCLEEVYLEGARYAAWNHTSATEHWWTPRYNVDEESNHHFYPMRPLQWVWRGSRARSKP